MVTFDAPVSFNSTIVNFFVIFGKESTHIFTPSAEDHLNMHYKFSINQLILYFDLGIRWNTLLILFQRVLSFSNLLLLFYALHASEFYEWTTALSFVYFFTLLADSGIKKSIARYLPSFLAQRAQSKFLIFVAYIYFFLGMLGAIAIIYFSKGYVLGHRPLILILFVLETLLNFIRRMYHAYFLYAPTAKAAMLFSSLESLSLAGSIYYISNNNLLTALFISKIVCILLQIAWLVLYRPSWQHIDVCRLLKKGNSLLDIPLSDLYSGFIVHLIIMTASAFIKGITERNFLILCLGGIFEPKFVNKIKMLYESAIFLQRIVFRIVASADTSFLSFALLYAPNVASLRQSVRFLCTRFVAISLFACALALITTLIIHLCTYIPYLATVVYKTPIFSIFYAVSADPAIAGWLILVSLVFLVETMLVPFERFFEVSRSYKILFLSYTPYLILVIPALMYTLLSPASEIRSLIVTHPLILKISILLTLGVRLASMLLMAYAYKKTNEK